MVNLKAPSQAPAGGRNPLAAAQFTVAAHELRQLPADAGAEVAFAGRSNAGKSSALNALCGQSHLARVSKTPGRTQQLVVFALDPEHRLIDLPGYGYAQVAHSLREHWRQVLDRYFRERASLRGLVLHMDIRHPLTEFDTLMLGFCAARPLPCHILLTKADKLSRSQGLSTMQQVKKACAARGWDAGMQRFSALKMEGIDEARGVVRGWLGI